MEWLIPTQTFQVEHVHLGSMLNGTKPLVPLAYKDSDIQFPLLNFLLPILTIKSYDQSTGKLILSIDTGHPSVSKLLTLQEMLLTAVHSNQSAWFHDVKPVKKLADIRAGFQPMITETELHLYCPTSEPSNPTHGSPNIYIKEKWSTGVQPGFLRAGQRVRIAFKLQGISFHIHTASNQWTGRFRLQHRILSILVA